MGYQDLGKRMQVGNGGGMDPAAAAIVSSLSPKIQQQANVVQNLGPVGQANISTDVNLGSLQPIILIANNSGSSTASWYKIGDPANIVQSALGLTVEDWSSSSTFQNEALKEFARYGFTLNQFNYQVSSNATQFAQPFNYSVVDQAGNLTTKKLASVITASQRNTQQNTLLQTASFPQGIKFVTGSGLFIYVLAGQTVTLTCSYAAVLQ